MLLEAGRARLTSRARLVQPRGLTMTTWLWSFVWIAAVLAPGAVLLVPAMLGSRERKRGARSRVERSSLEAPDLPPTA